MTWFWAFVTALVLLFAVPNLAALAVPPLRQYVRSPSKLALLVYYAYCGALLPVISSIAQGKWPPSSPWYGYLAAGSVGFGAGYLAWWIGRASRPVEPRW